MDGHKDSRAQAHAINTWADILPGAEVIRGVNEDTPYNKSAALNAAAAQAMGDVLIVTDRDLIYPAARTAVHRIEKGQAHWVMSDTVVRLGPNYTRRVERGAPLDRSLYRGDRTDRYRSKGGVLVIPRSAWDTVGGMDTRYRGWGSEDTAIVRALQTLVGPGERRGVQWHMWHPATYRPGRRSKLWVGQTEEHIAAREALNVRYQDAMGQPEDMRALLSERFVRLPEGHDGTDGDV